MKQIHKQCNKKIKVANKARFALFISILMLIAYPAIMLAMDKPTNNQEISFLKVYIEQGDTLWDIAKANLPPKTDIRDFIYEIKVVNRMDSALIREGEFILVPIKP